MNEHINENVRILYIRYINIPVCMYFCLMPAYVVVYGRYVDTLHDTRVICVYMYLIHTGVHVSNGNTDAVQ